MPTGTAFFGVSNTTNLSFSAGATIGGWTFNVGASNFDFSNSALLAFNGAGISINGGSATIVSNGGLRFFNTSTAGSAAITNTFFLEFFDTSTAGSAAIINNHNLRFHDASTAGSATIVNNGGLEFFNASSAGSATIVSNGGLQFLNTSTAGSAAITNDGVLQFFDNSTAGSATITNHNSLIFFNTSTAGSAAIINNHNLRFHDASTAGSATIVNNGGLQFLNTSTAGSAAITNDGVLQFFDNSTAGSSTITNSGILQFLTSSTAGSAAITTTNGGTTQFFNASSGGMARFITFAGGTIDISNLVSAGTTAGSIEGGGSYVLGAKNLTTGSNNLSTEVSGVISGAGGSLTKVGTGTLILSGANTYTGGTVLNGGTLGLAHNNALGTGQLTILGSAVAYTNGVSIANSIDLQHDATLNVDTGSATQAGAIGETGGSFGISKTGAGTLILSGANPYSGATNVNAGTLAGGAANAFSAASATTVNAGGALDLGGFAQTVDAVTLAGGTIQNGALTGAISSTGGTLNGIGGPTGLTTTAGITTAVGANTYSGATTVNGGTFVVNGSIVSPTTVNSGGAVGGTGTFGSVTLNGGTLAPGNSIGTVTVNGNLTFNGSSTYAVEVSPAAADSTNVTGTASLAGTVQALFQPGSYVARNYTILSAAGGLGGTTFGALTTSNLSAGFSTSLSYTATDVLLNLSAALGVNQGLAGNQQGIATAINTAFNSGSALPAGFLPVFNLSGPALGNALSQLSGEVATGFQGASHLSMGLFLNAMLDPFATGRSGSFGSAMAYAPQTPSRVQASAQEAMAASLPVKAAPAPMDAFGNRWSVWGSAYGGRNRTDGDVAAGSSDLTARAAGFAAGADYRVSPALTLGAAVAIGEAKWNVNGLGNGDSNVAQVGGYAAAQWNAFYASAALAGAWHNADTSRTVAVGGIDQLEADFDATVIGGRLEGGWRNQFGMFGLTPYAALQVQSVHTPAYSERSLGGAGTFALSYRSQTETDTRTELGFWADTRFALANGGLGILRGRAAWVHDFDPNSRINAIFQTLPGASFTVNGAAAARDAALASAVGEVQFRNGVSLIAKFDGEFSDRSQTYAGTGTVRYTW